MPQISVVMPAYNRSAYIGEAIQSLIDQTFTDWELIVLDDCSTDDTAEVVRAVEDPRIRLIEMPCKGTVPILRNYGIELSRGEFIAFMDSDDISPPRRLELEKDFLDQHPTVGVVSGNHQTFGAREFLFTPVRESEAMKQHLLFHTTICNGGSLIRKSVLDEHKIRLRPEYFVCEDYALWVDLMPHCDFGNLDETILLIRTGHGNITEESSRDQGRRRLRKAILDEIHRSAFEYFDFPMSEEELTLFNSFVGDCSVKVRPESEVDQLEALFEQMKERVEAHPRLSLTHIGGEFESRLARYRRQEIKGA